jgi:WD40 repeat protein
LCQSSTARAGEPENGPIEDTLPKGALLRLGTDRFRQEDEVKQVQYSPDGRRLASISNYAVFVWDAQTGRQLKRLRPQGDPRQAPILSALSFSPDGEEIAAADSARVYVWEVQTGLELISFPIDSRQVFGEDVQISYSPDGRWLAVASGLSITL